MMTVKIRMTMMTVMTVMAVTMMTMMSVLTVRMRMKTRMNMKKGKGTALQACRAVPRSELRQR